MKEYLITIDTGTTNTRCILWGESREPLFTQKREVGVRNTAIDGNNSALKEAVKDCLDGLLQDGGIGWNSVKRVIASGMITSNVGLVEIPHLVAPVGIDDFAAGIREVLLEDVCPLPISFIPGVKNSGDTITFDTLERMDIMRGEEVESCAVIERLHDGRPMVLVLPGSHTKFVAIDSAGRITGCLTSIAGELLSCITHNTIIADAVSRSYVEEDTYDREMVLRGYDEALKVGLARTCFSARIMNQFVTKDPATVANFVFGATLQGDVIAIKNSDAVRADENTTIVVSGKNPFRRALVDILEHDGSFGKVIEDIPDVKIPLSSLGCYIIAKKGNIL